MTADAASAPSSALDLTGRVALVTGATRGIGRASAQALLAAGASIVLVCHSENSESTATVDEFEAAFPGRVDACFGSVAEKTTVDQVGQLLTKKHKRLDVLVNNAGILKDHLIGMIPVADIDEVLKTNVVGVLVMTQLAVRFMARRRSGSIVNVASIIGRYGNPGQFVYGASKTAVIGATLSSAKELAPRGIRVNAVAPGLIDTRMIGAIPQTSRDKLQSQIGMARLGTPEDVAKAIVFLASDMSAYITGQVLGVDGGLVL